MVFLIVSLVGLALRWLKSDNDAHYFDGYRPPSELSLQSKMLSSKALNTGHVVEKVQKPLFPIVISGF